MNEYELEHWESRALDAEEKLKIMQGFFNEAMSRAEAAEARGYELESIQASVCPEDFGIVEYVEMLKSRAEAAEKKLEIAINATAPQVDAMLAAKLEAAEAERDSLQMQVVSHQNRIAELESYNHGIAETQDRLQAEVGELRKCFADANHKQILAEAEVETLKTLCTGKHEAFDDCG